MSGRFALLALASLVASCSHDIDLLKTPSVPDASSPPTDAGPGVDADVDAGPGVDAGDGGSVADADVCPTCIAQVTAGGQHSCALTRAGDVWCWGRNHLGQLGIAAVDVQRTPVMVRTGGTVLHVEAEHNTTCAVLDNGMVECWGQNHRGQLGTGDMMKSRRALAVPGVMDARTLGVGYAHVCAAVEGMPNIFCWGENRSGELGRDCSASEDPTAGPGPELAGLVDLDAGDGPSCAATSTAVYCWGWNGEGGLGANTGMPSSCDPLFVSSAAGLLGGASIVTVGGFEDFVGAVAHAAHGCAVTDAGTYCWGRNDFSQVDNAATPVARFAAVEVTPSGTGEIADISAGGRHTCLVFASFVYCWGDNAQRQLGADVPLGTAVGALPSSASALGGATRVSAGYQHTCALDGDGRVFCWGHNLHGQCAQRGTDMVPTAEVVTFPAGP